MTEPGAAQDEAAEKKWRERVLRKKHNILKFAPPFASCKCGGWQTSAPKDYGFIVQRDFLLDAFLAHRKWMASEKRRLLGNGSNPS